MVTTVAAILANPRYTGRQVWNRQHTDHDAAPPDRGIPRQRDIQRRGPTQDWAISERPAHPPLVSEEQFVAVQAIHTAPVAADGTARDYAFAGRVYCGICGRVMDAHWVHGRPGYRCRHGRNSATSRATSSTKILYIREDQLIDRIIRSCRLPRDLTTRAAKDPAAIGVYLKTRNMIIVCDSATWTIETETEVIPLVAPRNGLPTTAKIPIQRDGDQLDSELFPHSVWK